MIARNSAKFRPNQFMNIPISRPKSFGHQSDFVARSRVLANLQTERKSGLKRIESDSETSQP